MHIPFKKIMIFFLVAAMISVSFGAAAFAQGPRSEREGRDPGAMTVDFMLVRPFGVLALVTGACVFALAIPFSALGRNVKESSQKLVVAPFKYTFKRPLGEL